MSDLWLSRARLRADTPAVAALAGLLVPDGSGARVAAAHSLVWALFADGPDRQRDFLWREEAPGRFMTLSARPPSPIAGLFDVEWQPFAPALATGDRLGFTLRANPVVSRSGGPGQRGKRHDVVMDALRHQPKDQHAAARLRIATEAGRAWLDRQGAAHGFAPVSKVGIDGYEAVRIARNDGKADARYSRLDITGLLTVTDPTAFLPALAAGFGRARAFGCGLMLIRRA
jgi:CRISPR system Cascade subunit CasE